MEPGEDEAQAPAEVESAVEAVEAAEGKVGGREGLQHPQGGDQPGVGPVVVPEVVVA